MLCLCDQMLNSLILLLKYCYTNNLNKKYIKRVRKYNFNRYTMGFGATTCLHISHETPILKELAI